VADKYLCVDEGVHVFDPASGNTVPLRTFKGTTCLAFGSNLFGALQDDPAALQVLVYVARIVQCCGRPDSVNWVRCPRKDIARKTGQSTRTITRAIETLLAKGYLVRNEHVQCVYRIPAKYLLTGKLEKLPEPSAQNGSEFEVIVPPDEVQEAAHSATVPAAVPA